MNFMLESQKMLSFIMNLDHINEWIEVWSSKTDSKIKNKCR